MGSPADTAPAAEDHPGHRTWKREDWTPARRRKVLFTTWDDCEEAPAEQSSDQETVESTLDRVRIEAGQQARAAIIAFIRAELPADSPHAYPPAELHALNATRNSRQRFEPY